MKKNNIIDRNIFGSQEIAYECLADLERTDNFLRSINAQIKKNSVVLELGTGTGILALFAAKAGAKSVDAYELSVPMAQIAKKNIIDNNLENKISIYVDDVTTMDISTKIKYDVLIAEMITVGLIEEQLVTAFNNILKRGILKKSAISIPASQDTYVELVNTDFEHFGLKMRTIQVDQTWQESKVKHQISTKKLISRIDFNSAILSQTTINPFVKQIVAFRSMKNGIANAIRLSSNSILCSGIISGWTQCMNSPVIVPINEIQLKKGELVRFCIEYEMGGEMKSFKAEKV